jgi:outer membrane protein assembly factor BamB
MNVITKALSLAVPVTLSLTLAAGAAETPATNPGPAYGHADFVPTTERPVYFRQTLGYYPGAQPPLEFWDGTPALVDAEAKGRKTKIWDFADTKSKNIQWKARVPGWGLSHPIVVGKRVFAVGHPDFVTCWDLETGKQLWQRRIMPLMLEGLAFGKIPARPALSEDQAAKVQKLLDLAKALWNVTDGGPGIGASGQPNNMYGGGPLEKRKDFAAKICAMAQRCRPEVEAYGDAALVSALDKDIASLQGFAGIADDEAMKAYLTKERWGATNFWKAVSGAFNLQFRDAWMGYVGYADSTLASDGERIYGVFNQGQVYCLDLDGKLLWGFRDQVDRDNRGTFHQSPTLCQGLLLVPGYNNKSRGFSTMRAFDAKTGKLRWESPFPGSNYTVPRVVPLARPTGEVVPVLVGNGQEPKQVTSGYPILRIADGVKVGELPPVNGGRGLLLGVVEDVVMFASGSDTGGGDNGAYRLQWTGPDSVAAQELFLKKDRKDKPWYNQHEFPTVFGKYWYGGSCLFDATTGERVGQFGGRMGFPSVAGHYLIGMTDDTGDAGRDRSDNKAMARFVVVDVQDPANPKVVSDKNLLGFAEPASDIFIEQYYKDIGPFEFVGGYRGAASYFLRMTGPVAIGKRLLIQTPAFLYCIGPAIEGAPGDNPATVQAIRAAKPAELATYLSSPSALYRHTAVTAMITAGIGGTKEALTRLVKEDPYEQIRAAAVLALNAAEPDAAPGTQALLPLMTAAWIGGGHDGRPERRALQLTLDALGKERGTALLVAAFTKTQDAATRQSVVDFAALMGWAAPELTQQAKAYLASNGLLGARYLLGLIKTDPEVREAVKRAYPQLGFEINLMLVDPLGQALEGEEKIAFLLHGTRINLRGDRRPDDRAPYLRQLQAMGRGAASAIPELEKMVAARADLAPEFAPVIEAIKGK